MCWNAEISLNTFLFSTAALSFIIYNNAYTKYKIPFFNDWRLYIFSALAISMQLDEFFLWRNLKNPFYNYIGSLAGLMIIYLQPIATISLLSVPDIRNAMMAIYACFAVASIFYVGYTNKIRTDLSTNGHLSWKFMGSNAIGITFLAFLLLPFFLEKMWLLFGFGFVTVLVSMYNYARQETVGSMWCWTTNSFFLFLLAYVLIYLPFKENCAIC